jgi:hypothetical protein
VDSKNSNNKKIEKWMWPITVICSEEVLVNYALHELRGGKKS